MISVPARNRSSRVSIVKVKRSGIPFAVGRAIDLLGGYSASDEDHVLIKPNLCDLISSQAGATTDPAVVAGLIDYLRRDASPRISIIESNHWAASAEKEFESLGYRELAEEKKVETVNLSKLPRRRVKMPFPSFYDEIQIPEIFFEADGFISVAKLKTHHFECISGVLKNQFGCLPQQYKATYHPFLPDIVAALNLIIQPDLSLVDGIVAMEGLGPTAGDTKRLGIIMAGLDPVAVDSVIARIAGFCPTEIPHLLRSWRAGVGEFAAESEIVGDGWKNLRGAMRFIDPVPFQLSRLGLNTQKMQRILSKRVDQVGEYLMLSGSALSSGSLGLRGVLAFGCGRAVRELKRSTGSL
jgi:uncharacterized protein (DUF362 family)